MTEISIGGAFAAVVTCWMAGFGGGRVVAWIRKMIEVA